MNDTAISDAYYIRKKKNFNEKKHETVFVHGKMKKINIVLHEDNINDIILLS